MRCQRLFAAICCLCVCGYAGDLFGQQRFAGWGALIDPNGDCGAKVEGGRFRFSLDGLHDLSDDVAGNRNAPRVLQRIDGDFVALLAVGGEFAPAGPSTLATRRPYNGGGFLLWQDEKNYFRLERAAIGIGGRIVEYLNFQQQKDGVLATSHNELPLQPARVQLRLERRNGKLYASATYDNQRWQGYQPLEVRLPGKLQIGVIAVSTSAKPFAPEFEELELYRRAPPDPGEAVRP